jgi:diaminopimelate epimerase
VAFTKLHGLGNSYLYIDARDGRVPEQAWPDLARLLSDRRRGVGSDGLIAVFRGQREPWRMRIWNRDGSEAEMCGNGVRGFAKYLYDRGLAGSDLVIETGAGLVRTQVTAEDNGRASEVAVDMGRPRFRRAQIPMTGEPDAKAVEVDLPVAGGALTVTAVSMGNPHVVHFAQRLWDRVETERVGRQVEKHPWFPQHTNFHVAVVESRNRVHVRHWERGAGLTDACGTGASAVLVAGVITGRLDRTVQAELPGGVLRLSWADDAAPVIMTGPAVEVLEGTFALR